MNLFVEHKDFITLVALHGYEPDRTSARVKSILNEYKKIDPTITALSECNTCKRPFEKAFKLILAYCESKNWSE